MLFQEGTEIGPLHAYPLSRTGDVSIEGSSNMGEELAFKRGNEKWVGPLEERMQVWLKTRLRQENISERQVSTT